VFYRTYRFVPDMTSEAISQAEMSQTSTAKMEESSTSTENQADALDTDEEAEVRVYMRGAKLHLLTLGYVTQICSLSIQLTYPSTMSRHISCKLRNIRRQHVARVHHRFASRIWSQQLGHNSLPDDLYRVHGRLGKDK
jgi:hypothetical protein